MRDDGSHAAYMTQIAFAEAAGQMMRPSVLMRPSLSADGSQWCALYGDDLMSGVAGFGDTPADAMLAFDHAWATQKTPASAPSSAQETSDAR